MKISFQVSIEYVPADSQRCLSYCGPRCLASKYCLTHTPCSQHSGWGVVAVSSGTNVFTEDCKEDGKLSGLPGTVLDKAEQLAPWMCQEPSGPELWWTGSVGCTGPQHCKYEQRDQGQSIKNWTGMTEFSIRATKPHGKVSLMGNLSDIHLIWKTKDKGTYCKNVIISELSFVMNGGRWGCWA